jgi:hypothetical protein
MLEWIEADSKRSSCFMARRLDGGSPGERKGPSQDGYAGDVLGGKGS